MNLFCSKGADLNEKDLFNQTPLFYASRDGQYECIQKMIELGANINQKDKVSQTALFYASREGKTDVCRLLLDNGAEVNQIDHKKQTALYFAKKGGHSQTAQLLLERGAINTKDGRLRQSDINKYSKKNKNNQKNKKNESLNESHKDDDSVSEPKVQESLNEIPSISKKVTINYFRNLHQIKKIRNFPISLL